MTSPVAATRFQYSAKLLSDLLGIVRGNRVDAEPFFLLACFERKDHEFLLDDGGEAPLCPTTREEAESLAAVKSSALGVPVEVLGPFRPSTYVPGRYKVTPVRFHFTRAERGDNEAALDSTSVSVDVIPECDLACWSVSAFEKFIAPYYFQHWGGNASAAARVQQLKRNIFTTGSGIMGHKWPTMSMDLGTIDDIERLRSDSAP